MCKCVFFFYMSFLFVVRACVFISFFFVNSFYFNTILSHYCSVAYAETEGIAPTAALHLWTQGLVKDAPFALIPSCRTVVIVLYFIKHPLPAGAFITGCFEHFKKGFLEVRVYFSRKLTHGIVFFPFVAYVCLNYSMRNLQQLNGGYPCPIEVTSTLSGTLFIIRLESIR